MSELGKDSGDPRAKQVRAEAGRAYGSHVMKKVSRPARRFLWITILPGYDEEIEVDLDTRKGDEMPDDVRGVRVFEYTCGLIKAVNSVAGNHSGMTLYLDGFPNAHLSVANTRFKFDPALENGPVAEIRFRGFGTRYGEFEHGRTDEFVTLIFKDEAQMRSSVVAVAATPAPETSIDLPMMSSLPQSGFDLWPVAAGALIAFGIASGS
jgi:hypothetical protein